MSRLITPLIRLHAPAWRSRYGAEFEQMLLDELADAHQPPGWWLNIAAHALRTRLPRAPRRSTLATVFGLLALALWAQLAVGWQWAPPADPSTRLGMELMTAGLLVLLAITVATTVRTAALNLSSLPRAACAVALLTAVALAYGAIRIGSVWPGTGGHAWAGRALVPAPLARPAWALTLWISSYWAHPHALQALGWTLEAWMIACPVLLLTLASSMRKLLRAAPASRASPLVTATPLLRIARGGAMLTFLVGAACWTVYGSAGPHRLFAAGRIDLVLLLGATVLMTAALRARPPLALSTGSRRHSTPSEPT